MKKIFTAALLLALFYGMSFAGKEDMDLVNKGITLFKAGQYQESVDVFEQALYINPDNFYAAQYSGMAYLKLGDQESALLQFERAYYVNPSPKTKKYIDQLKARVRGAGAFILYPVTIEVMAGLNMTSFLGRDTGYYYGSSAYTFGLEIFVNYHVTEWFCITAGAMYTEKTGSVVKDSYSDPTYYYRGSYLDLPLLADFRIKTGWSDNVEISIFLGGYIGLITSAAYTPDDYYSSPPPIDRAGINNTESGMVFGTGGVYYFGKVAVSVKEIIILGMTNVHDAYDAKTMVFMTAMGVVF